MAVGSPRRVVLFGTEEPPPVGPRTCTPCVGPGEPGARASYSEPRSPPPGSPDLYALRGPWGARRRGVPFGTKEAPP